jgi:imidazolonepropionase
VFINIIRQKIVFPYMKNSKPTVLTIIKNASQILTMQDKSLGIIENSSILFDDKIIAIGNDEEISKIIDEKYREIPIEAYDASGCIVMPGFVDSHTHLIFAGSRESEFEMRLEGKKYLDILKSGGGIHSSVNSTRNAHYTELVELGRQRLNSMLSYGTTTVEAKSGYGLDKDTELNMLRAIKELNSFHEIDIFPTFLGAHAIPKEYEGNPREYLDFLIDEVLPIVKQENLAEFCDIFCEKGVFEVEDSRYFLGKAKEMGFSLKIHADEIYPEGGAELAVELGAISADHLGAISDNGIKSLANSDTTATLLPGTLFYLMSDKFAPARKMINEGCSVALATDFNPGSCFCENMQMILSLAMLKMKMTPKEAIYASTKGGAMALGLSDRGELSIGKLADILIINAPNYLYFAHKLGVNQVKRVYKRGSSI